MQTTTFGEYQLSKLMLGTAQFGSAYGIANASGQPSFKEICAILESAFENGINCLDTAPLYGDSEEILGRALRATGLQKKMVIVSKAMRTVDSTLSTAKTEKAVEEEVVGSLRRLQIKVLPVCLMHSETNFRSIEALLKLQERGLIEHVGCSVTDVSKARGIYRSGKVEAMQIPLNLLDRRLTQPRAGGLNFLDEATNRGVTLFSRSAYLQGLIVMEPQKVPASLQAVVPTLIALRALAEAMEMSIEEMALRAVLSWEKISCVVIGIESQKQLQENLKISQRGALDSHLIEKINSLIPHLPEKILTPHLWNQ